MMAVVSADFGFSLILLDEIRLLPIQAVVEYTFVGFSGSAYYLDVHVC